MGSGLRNVAGPPQRRIGPPPRLVRSGAMPARQDLDHVEIVGLERSRRRRSRSREAGGRFEAHDLAAALVVIGKERAPQWTRA
jgi:hypothetical protein